MWQCAGCQDDGDLMKGVEIEGDCRKLKIYTKLDLTINEALLSHGARRLKEKELDLMPTLSQETLLLARKKEMKKKQSFFHLFNNIAA